MNILEKIQKKIDQHAQHQAVGILLGTFGAIIGLLSALKIVMDAISTESIIFCIIAIIFLIIALSCIGLIIFIITTQNKKVEISQTFDFEPDSKDFFGYSRQKKQFSNVVDLATIKTSGNTRAPIISVFGPSGIGKSSFVSHFFNPVNESSDRFCLFRLDLRENIKEWFKELKKLCGFPDTINETKVLSDWLIHHSPPEQKRISSVLFLDQFEQIIIDQTSMEFFSQNLSELCKWADIVVLAVRTETLGDSVSEVHNLLKDARKLFSQVRLFVLEPLIATDNDLGSFWSGIATKVYGNTPNLEFLEKAKQLFLKNEKNKKYLLPIDVKLFWYALKISGIRTENDLQVNWSSENFEKTLITYIIENTESPSLALKILMALSGENGLSTSLDPKRIEYICGLGSGNKAKDHACLDNVLSSLEKTNAICKMTDGNHLRIAHEQLSKLAWDFSKTPLSLPEQKQIELRQKECKSGDTRECRIDAKSYATIFSFETVACLLAVVIIMIRLFIWSPDGGWFITSKNVINPAIATCGLIPFYWLLGGNFRLALIDFEDGYGRILAVLTSSAPMLYGIAVFFYPDYWFYLLNIPIIIVILRYWQLSQWTQKNNAEDASFLFRRFRTTALFLICFTLFIPKVLTLAQITAPQFVEFLYFMLSIGLGIGLFRFAVIWWEGRHLKQLLAIIDNTKPIPYRQKSRTDK